MSDFSVILTMDLTGAIKCSLLSMPSAKPKIATKVSPNAPEVLWQRCNDTCKTDAAGERLRKHHSKQRCLLEASETFFGIGASYPIAGSC